MIPEVPFETCPIRSSLGVLGRKWSLLVLRDVAFLSPLRFSQILRNNPGMTPRVLCMRLQELQKEGLIERNEDPADDRVVNYRLTQKGRDTIPVLTAFIQYGARHHAGRVFEDGKPRTIGQLFPGQQKVMLGRLIAYAKATGPSGMEQPRPRH